MDSDILRVRRVFREVSLGRMEENAGTSSTSSKVSAFWRRRMVFPIGAKADYTEILDSPCKMEANQLTEMPKHGEIVPVHFTNGFAMNSIWRKRTSIASGALAALI